MNLHTNLDLTAFWLSLGAVLGISAVSATFSRIFFSFLAGFGCCFGDFCSFSYFFTDFFRLLGWILGAVLGISVVSATFSQIFPDVGLGFGLVLEYNHKKNQTCY